MLRFLVPRIAPADLPAMVGVALAGAIVAGAYGVLHDQVTFSISPEYFTKLKFAQFDYADFGLGDRVFVSTIGFLATWWVGFVIAWFLARRLIPGQPRASAYRQIRAGFIMVFAFAVVFAFAGYAYGLWLGPSADDSSWEWAARQLYVEDLRAFARVAYIHNASYLGGLAGLIVTLVTLRPEDPTRRHRSQDQVAC